MKIKTVSYQRVLNLTNFNSERLELFAEVEDDEEPTHVADKLRFTVNSMLDESIADMMRRHNSKLYPDINEFLEKSSKKLADDTCSELDNF